MVLSLIQLRVVMIIIRNHLHNVRAETYINTFQKITFLFQKETELYKLVN